MPGHRDPAHANGRAMSYPCPMRTRFRFPRPRCIALIGALALIALGQAAGLFVAGGVEGHVHMALEAQLAVPVGLAVADQDEFGHACHYRMYTHDCKVFWPLPRVQHA